MARDNLLQKCSSLFPLFAALSAYAIFIRLKYWVVPITSDALSFSFCAAFPDKKLFLFERYFNFYVGHIFTVPFANLLEGFALLSFIYHLGSIIFAYLIVRKLSGCIQAITTVVLISLFPTFFIWSREFFSDSVCLFWGLGALYFSLGKDRDRSGLIRDLLSGFFLVGAIFSKLFGLFFVIPVFLNMCGPRFVRRLIVTLFGTLFAFSFIAVCDHLFVQEFFYHLNPQNYIAYKDLIARKLSERMDPDRGKSIMGDFFDGVLRAYCVFFIIFLLQVTRSIQRKEIFTWEKRGVIAVSLVGISVFVDLLVVGVRYPGVYLLVHYYTCVYVPWIIAFCAMVGPMNNAVEEGRFIFRRETAVSVVIAATYVFWLLAARESPNYLFAKNFSFAILVFCAVLGAASGNVGQKDHVGRLASFLFILGCAGMIWHGVTWGQLYVKETRWLESNKQVSTFLTRCKDLSRVHAVVPFDCNVPMGDEIREYMLLTKVVDAKAGEYFKSTEGLEKMLWDKDLPLYLLTRLASDELEKKLRSTEWSASAVEGSELYGCRVYLLERRPAAWEREPVGDLAAASGMIRLAAPAKVGALTVQGFSLRCEGYARLQAGCSATFEVYATIGDLYPEDLILLVADMPVARRAVVVSEAERGGRMSRIAMPVRIPRNIKTSEVSVKLVAIRGDPQEPPGALELGHVRISRSAPAQLRPAQNVGTPMLSSGGLLKNAGFETGEFGPWKTWTDDYLKLGVWAAIDAQASHSGKYSARVDFLGGTDPQYVSLTQVVDLKPGTKYKLSFYSKTDGVSSRSLPTIAAHPEPGPKYFFSEPLGGTHDWTYHELMFETSPRQSSTEIRVVRLGDERRKWHLINRETGLIVGSVWFDDFNLVELK